MSELENVSNAVIQGDAMAAEEATRGALDKGLSAAVILKQGLIPAMDVVGQAMKSGEYFIHRRARWCLVPSKETCTILGKNLWG